jgi:HK97 family phage prohead protease
MENLRYTLPLLDLKSTGPAGVIEGLAATWGFPPDLHGDVLQKNAFSKSLLDPEAAGTRPAMLWGHSQSDPIGKWLEIHETDAGLEVTGQLTLGVRKADEAMALAVDGALGLSIGFRPIQQEPHKGANVISEVYLGEISLVGMAANPKAVVTSVKSLDQVSSISEYQTFLRELGLSVREAKRLARGGWGAYRGDGLEAELAEYLEKSAHKFRGIKS